MLESKLRRTIALRWKDARTAEWVLDEIAREFDGEDALKPATREALAGAKASLLRTAGYFEHYGNQVELAEPAEEDREVGRRLLEQGRKLFS